MIYGLLYFLEGHLIFGGWLFQAMVIAYTICVAIQFHRDEAAEDNVYDFSFLPHALYIVGLTLFLPSFFAQYSVTWLGIFSCLSGYLLAGGIVSVIHWSRRVDRVVEWAKANKNSDSSPHQLLIARKRGSIDFKNNKRLISAWILFWPWVSCHSLVYKGLSGLSNLFKSFYIKIAKKGEEALNGL